jgi:hypothetical protein
MFLVLVAGWSENGWLVGGHAVRMALELSMHNAWPKLRRRMKNGNAQKYDDDRTLVSACRTWFTLYIFEHQWVTFTTPITVHIDSTPDQDIVRNRPACYSQG